ncbi:MAG: VOC family protein [Sandaracinaceae bacterium]
MKFLHTMLRVHDLDAAIAFYVGALGLTEVRRRESERGRFTLVFLSTGAEGDAAEIELTYNWPSETGEREAAFTGGRYFGHLAFRVDDIYATCARLQEKGVAISRPPRDGRMAFVRSPDLHSIELLQRGDPLAPAEPWASMPNVGEW